MRICYNCAAAFANGTFGAAFVSSDGTWLSDPMAVLRATSGGKPVSALLRLSNPHYDAANNILTLGVRNSSGSLITLLLPVVLLNGELHVWWVQHMPM